MKVEKKIDFKKDLFFEVFSLYNDFAHWNIASSDVKILSELYTLDFELKNSGAIKGYNDRMNILFSKDNKTKLIDKLGISYNTFNNSLTKLRKKGLITDNTIDEGRLFDLNKGYFTFTISFKDAKKTTS
ncbi:MAG: hypothetical protein GY775_19425 [Candidatus Scalindua sp.]|nr:hypothetical protein [Candidatus Scalindua sp.]